MELFTSCPKQEEIRSQQCGMWFQNLPRRKTDPGERASELSTGEEIWEQLDDRGKTKVYKKSEEREEDEEEEESEVIN